MKKQILATFKPNNKEGFDFYILQYKTKDNLIYVLKNNLNEKIYCWFKNHNILIDLNIKVLPKEEQVYELVNHKNIIDNKCIMFLADSLFLDIYGLVEWKDLIYVKEKILNLDENDNNIDRLLDYTKSNNLIKYFYFKFKKWILFRNKRKLRKLLKEYKIIWKN